MTHVTPPGWYPDPGQQKDGPATERWWDGDAWTDRVRPAGPDTPEAPPARDGAPETAGPAEAAGTTETPGTAETPGTTEAAGAGGAGEPGADAGAGASPEEPETGPAGQGSAEEAPAGSAPGPLPPSGPPAPATPPAPAGQPHHDAGRPPHGTGPSPYGTAQSPYGTAQSAYGGAQPPYGAGPQPGAYPQYPGPAGYASPPGYPAPPPGGRRRSVRTAIAAAVAAVVLASIGVGVYALSADGPGGDRAGSRQQSTDGPGRQDGPFGGDGDGPDGASPSPDGSGPPKIDSGSVTDSVSGISLPIPDGWYGQEITVGASVSSDDTYPCPGDSSADCSKGGAYSAPALVLGTEGRSAEEVAKADIAANAEESYGKGYGSLSSHEVLASEAVTVAGQKGYRVRWKAVTSKGADGYVESLALPSPANPERIVVVRIGVDVGEKQSVIDDIAEGIEAASGGGTGQDV